MPLLWELRLGTETGAGKEGWRVGVLPACGWPFLRLSGHAIAPWLEATLALCIHGMALDQWPWNAGRLGASVESVQTSELGGSP